MSERWIVWGQGGHAVVVAEAVMAAGGAVVGWAALEPSGADAVADADLRTLLAEGRALPFGARYVALGIGDNATRLACARLLAPGQSPPVVHPTAWRSPSCVLGEGTVLLPGAVVHARSRIGRAGIVNTRAVVDHDSVLGDGVHVSVGACLTSRLQVGDLAFIGAGAVVRPDQRIGEGAVVGAGAVVVRDVAPGAVVAGNPARPLRTG